MNHKLKFDLNENSLVFAHTIIGELVLTKSQREKYQALYEEKVKESKQRIRIIQKAG